MINNLRILQIVNTSPTKTFILGFFLVTIIQLYLLIKENRRYFKKPYIQKERTNLIISPKISVLVPAWNESAHISSHIESFLTLRYPSKELIVCAGGSDGTFPIAQKFIDQNVKIIRQSEGDGKQKSLYKCYEKASGDIIFFADGDGRFDDDSFERTIYPIIHSGENAVTGGTRPLDNQMSKPFPLYQWLSEEYGLKHDSSYTSLLRGCNSAINRQTLDKAWDKDYKVYIGTDEFLSARLKSLGIKIFQDKFSRIKNEYPENLRSYLRQQSRWLRVEFFRSTSKVSSSIFRWLTFIYYLTPLFLIFSGLILDFSFAIIGILIYYYMFCTRIRIIKYCEKSINIKYPLKNYPNLIIYLFFDVLVRFLVLCQIFFPFFRFKW